jgi:molecular chaperone GrpE (heat shock protein)
MPQTTERSYDMIQEQPLARPQEAVSRETEPSTPSSLCLKLDVGPLATLLQEMADTQETMANAMDQQSETQHKALATAAGKLDLVMQCMNNLETFNAVSQQNLQDFEAEQRRLGQQAIRQAYLNPFAKKLLGLWRSVEQFVSEPFAISALTDEVTVTLSDFTIELIAPEPGDPFDARTMKPQGVAEKNEFHSPVVTRLYLPGACHGDFVLEHALVQIRDRLDRERSPSGRKPELLLRQQTAAKGSRKSA